MATYGSNVLTGGTASASTDRSGGYPASQAVDANDSTRWASDDSAFPCWWKYDLGSGVTKQVQKIGFKLASTEHARDFRISASNDNSTWTPLFQTVGGNNTSWQYYTFYNGTAYRYYRMEFFTVWAGVVGSLTEIQMYELTDPTGVTLSDDQFLYGGTPSASSDRGGTTYAASKACDWDWDSSTRWATNDGETNGWWQYDLGSGKTRVINNFEMLAGSTERPDAFKVQGSNDGTSWTDLLTTNGANVSSWQTFAVTNTTGYRYYRMAATTVYAGVVISVTDFRMWESPTYPAAPVTLAPDPVAIPLVIPAPDLDIPQTLSPTPVVLTIVIPAPFYGGLDPVPVPIVLVVPAPVLTRNLAPDPIAIPLVIPAQVMSGGVQTLVPSPVAIPLAVPAPSIVRALASLHQLFDLLAVSSELSQPFDLLAPTISLTLHQLFDLSGPVGSALSQPFTLVTDTVGSTLSQLFDFLAAGPPGGDPPGGRSVPPIWLPLMVFDKAGTYLGSIAEVNVTVPPTRYLRSRRVQNEGSMTFSIPRSSPDIGLVAPDRLVRLQSRQGEEPWWGTMAPKIDADGAEEVECLDGYTVLRDGPAIELNEEVSDDTPATAVYARLMAIHNDLRAATGDLRWELDLGGSRAFRGDLDLDTDTMSALDVVILRSRTEIAVSSRLEGNRLVPILRVRDRFEPGAGAAIYDGPGGNVLAGVKVIEDPTPLRFSIRLRGISTDLAKCLPEWAQWALLDITPEVTVSVDPGAYRNRQTTEESLDWGLSKAAVAAQCAAIQAWIWEMYRSFLRAVHDIEGRPWHDGWAYLGPPDIYEPTNAGKDSLSRRAFRTRLQLVEVHTDEPASAVMISDKNTLHNLREWLIVRYNRVSGVQTVQVYGIPEVVGASLVAWRVVGSTTLYKVSGGRIVDTWVATNTGTFVSPYSTRVWDPVAKRYRNLRMLLNGNHAIAWYLDPSNGTNILVDLGADAAIDQVAGDGSSLIAKMYDFEADRIDDYDPRRDGIGILKSALTVFNGAQTSRPRWHIVSFDTGADATTALTTGISATDTDFEVDSIMGFPDPDAEASAFPFLASIDQGSNREVVLVLSMLGALWHVVRGQLGTEAIIHEAGAPVAREGAESWAGFPFPYTWPEGEAWASEELADLSKPYIRVGSHIAHFRGDQATIDYGSTHATNVATEGPPGRWVGTQRVIGWSTNPGHSPGAGDPTPPGGETEIVGEWVDA